MPWAFREKLCDSRARYRSLPEKVNRMVCRVSLRDRKRQQRRQVVTFQATDNHPTQSNIRTFPTTLPGYLAPTRSFDAIAHSVMTVK